MSNRPTIGIENDGPLIDIAAGGIVVVGVELGGFKLLNDYNSQYEAQQKHIGQLTTKLQDVAGAKSALMTYSGHPDQTAEVISATTNRLKQEIKATSAPHHEHIPEVAGDLGVVALFLAAGVAAGFGSRSIRHRIIRSQASSSEAKSA
jgi:hypothetical protein